MATKTTKVTEEEVKHDRITPDDFDAADAVDEALDNEEPTEEVEDDVADVEEVETEEEDGDDEEDDPAPSPKKSQKQKTREKIRNRTQISEVELRKQYVSKARRMKELLASQPQVPWFIPLSHGESENSTETVIINGHMEIYPKGKQIIVPLQIQQVLAAAYGIDTSETERQFNIAKNPRLQEPLG